MLQTLFLFLPIVTLALYIKRERTIASIKKSGILLFAAWFFLYSLGNDVFGNSLAAKFITFIGFLVSYGYAVKLGFKGKDVESNTLTKEQNSEAFSFNATKKPFNYEKPFGETKKDLTIVNPFRGVLIVGGAGSGKSRSFLYPIISQCAKNGFTGVLYDFKSPELMDLAENCYGTFNPSVGIAKVDFKDPTNSQRANPLAYVQSAMHATNYSQAFIYNLMPEYIQKQDFWSRSMLAIFSGAIWYFKRNAPELATLPHIFAFFFTYSAQDIVTTLSQDKEVKGYISSLAEAVEQGAEKQVAGVLGTLKNAIGIYNTPEIFWILSADETNLNVNDPNNPTMLLIGNNSTLSDSYAPLCSLIITVCSKLMNEPNKLKSAIIIDESPTIYLPNFEQIPATARSNKVAVIVGAQDISQMNDRYGRDKTEVLISNLGNQFYGRTTNKETAERVVKMFGQREDVVQMQSSKRNIFLGYINSSKSESIQKRDRIKIQEMTTLDAGKFAGIMAEGKNKEFIEQIELQDVPTTGKKPFKSSYSAEFAKENFDTIYNEIADFFSEAQPKIESEKEWKYGEEF